MSIFADIIPLDMHCHGIGKFDFMEPSSIVLERINDQLTVEGIRSVLTMYIPRHRVNELEQMLHEFHCGRKTGKYSHIVGIALEGPMLASFGGTPEQGCWIPTKVEWMRLARLGRYGLIYIVLSPDSDFCVDSSEEYPPNIEWIIDTLYSNHIRPALGHYKKDDPDFAAQQTRRVIQHVASKGYSPLFTDHLFNDMPLNFKHSWRTVEEKLRRESDLLEINTSSWNENNLIDCLGPVPAAIIEGARAGHVKICMNFDGEHVDLEICKAAIRVIGSENLMLMTDRIQSGVLAGQLLSTRRDTTLLYQNKNIVAGGTLSVFRQIMKMINIGIENNDIVNVVALTASYQLGCNPYGITGASERLYTDKLFEPEYFEPPSLPKSSSIVVPEIFTAYQSKKYRYPQEAYFQESWHQLISIFDSNIDLLNKYTFILFKPDAAVGRCLEKAFDYLRMEGFLPVFSHFFRFTRHSIRELWRYELNASSQDRYPVIDSLLQQADSLIVVLKYDRAALISASEKITELKGPTDLKKRQTNHLRSFIGAGDGTLNFVHTPDETIDFIREIGVLLNEHDRESLGQALRNGGELEDFFESQLQGLEDWFYKDIPYFNFNMENILDKYSDIDHSDINYFSREGMRSINNLVDKIESTGISLPVWERIILRSHTMFPNAENVERILDYEERELFNKK